MQRGRLTWSPLVHVWPAQVGLATAILLLGISLFNPAQGGDPVDGIVFATVGSQELRVNVQMPEGVENPPLVVSIYGGGWNKKIHTRVTKPWLTEYGFAVASIDYRLAPESIFPAQIHDCKAAVRWLRAHADDFGYDAERIGVLGESAGGHLAVLLGVTGGDAQLEGEIGGNSDQSSRVQAVVNYYGPMDLVLRSQNQPEKTEKPDSPVYLLLGQPGSRDPIRTRAASPAFYVTPDDAPLLIFHGDEDDKVRMDQSQRIVEEYQRHGLEVTLEVVKGGRHGSNGDEPYLVPEYKEMVAKFLDAHLRKR